MMKTCTFFGHRNSSDSIESELYKVVEELINNESIERFYVGNQGNFDNTVYRVLNDLRQKYTHIHCYVVLAYMPKENDTVYKLPTVYPEGLEKVPLRYAVSRRNKWMIDNSQLVVTFVTHNSGGAARFSKIAEKKGLTVINIIH